MTTREWTAAERWQIVMSYGHSGEAFCPHCRVVLTHKNDMEKPPTGAGQLVCLVCDNSVPSNWLPLDAHSRVTAWDA